MANTSPRETHDPFERLRGDEPALLLMIEYEPALCALGGIEGVDARRRTLLEAADAVADLPDWPEERKRGLIAELLAAADAWEAWRGFVLTVQEELEKAGWRYQPERGAFEATDPMNRPRAQYAETVCELYDALRPAYVAETGDRRTRNPKALRERVAARLAGLPSEYRDTRVGGRLWQAVQNYLKR